MANPLLLLVLSAPSASLYQAWTVVLAAGVSHSYELVPRVRGSVGKRGLTSLHIFPGAVLPSWSQWSHTCNIMGAGFQELIARSFSV